MAAVVCFGDKVGGETDAGRGFTNIAGLAYFFIWYVLSGRKQASYVKDAFGKTYAKKSMVKPVLAALGAAVVYAVAVFGLLVATQGSSDAADKAGGQVSSGGPLSNVAALFGGAPNLDCASKDVKQIITDKWNKEFHDAVVQECGKQPNAALCKCKIEQFAQVLKQEDFQRISFFVQTKTLDADRGIRGHLLDAIRALNLGRELVASGHASKVRLEVENVDHPIDLMADRLKSEVTVNTQGRYPVPQDLYAALSGVKDDFEEQLVGIFGQ
ncbi:hypothetical protein RALBFv3_12080 [Ralstonia solanacearum]|nr:hypothetical protein RALBFv3_12080 [Ralstonia solanacearum]